MKSFVTVKEYPVFLKILLFTKLTAMFILLFTFNASADGSGQQKISLKVKNAQISNVLATIEKQTTYRFLYNNDLEGIRQKVNLSVQDADLKQVLDEILLNTDLGYEFMENNLVVIKSGEGTGVFEVQAVINGKVTGENNLPLSGVSVQVKGSNKGTFTNAD